MSPWFGISRLVFAFGGALASLGCAATHGRFTETAYRNNDFPFAVRYAGAGPSQLLGPDWVVENFKYVDGAPDSQKRGPRYFVTRRYDLNGDGTNETKADEPAWDLRLEHRREDAVIWLASVPLSDKDRDKLLPVLADRVLQSLSGSESVATAEREAPAVIGTSEQRSAVRLISSFPCALSGREAFGVDFDEANVDALTLSPDGRTRRVRLVLIRSGYVHRPSTLKNASEYPVFIVAGYSNSPVGFPAHLQDFHRFLAQTILGTDQGSLPTSVPPHTCAAPAPAPEIAKAPPPPFPGIPAAAPANGVIEQPPGAP